MATNMDVFVRSDLDMPAFTTLVARTLNTEFEASYETNGQPYAFTPNPGMDLHIYKHDFLDEDDLPFTRFPYDICVRSLPLGSEVRSGDQALAEQKTLARWVYEHIVRAQIGPAMLVEGLQIKLAQSP